MHKFELKTEKEVKVMAEGGKKLAQVRQQVAEAVKPGITAGDLEILADKLIKKAGGLASFKMVPGYSYATCININEVVVHGIPKQQKIAAGDVVGIDVGLYYEGFHTDAAVTVVAGEGTAEINKFVDTGRKALKKAINQARVGKRVADISKALQDNIEAGGYSVVRALTGHGVGKELHEEPAIPCFVVGKYEYSPKLTPGMVLAIEVMYNMGKSDVAYKNDDGWTIITADGKISGLFEETVAVTKNGPVILTQLTNDK